MTQTDYLALYRQLRGPVANDNDCATAVHAAAGRAWVERVIRLHSAPGEPLWVPLALDAEIGDVACSLGRPCWLVSPHEIEARGEGLEFRVGDPFDVAAEFAADVAGGALPRLLPLALMDLSRADGAADVVRRLCRHLSRPVALRRSRQLPKSFLLLRFTHSEGNYNFHDISIVSNSRPLLGEMPFA